ncbi:MAG: polysaccharide deacetylase family protein [Marinilabiliaceae bacterium]|nr:polysaccharide deacetylase family protein [Marinilabiliaceae bacterium]
MYHYVRNLVHSRYPEIKGLDISLFKEQIAYLKKHYNFITVEWLINSIEGNSELPPKAVLLTFDDAYIDHFNYVFPILNAHSIQGAFYPPVKTIKEHSVLDVNKIHYILASVDDKKKIISEIKVAIQKYREEFNLHDFDYYYKKLGNANRFDSEEVIFIKRLLQVELDENLRNIINSYLFEKFIGMEESSFSRELYMDIEQIKCMNRNGMHIGVHGYDHFWLGSLSRDKQKYEIEKSLEFLKEIDCDLNKWTMCYPYGNYNETTIDLLSEYNCKLAFTTEVNVADIKIKHRFTLPRLDTNDIPKEKNSEVNEWYYKS